MLFSTTYLHRSYNCNDNQNVLCVFLFIYVLNNFFKFYGYCRVSCLEVPIIKVILVSILFFIYNLLVWSHYHNFIKEFNNFFYLSMSRDNGTRQARVGIFFALKLFIKC